MTESLIPYSFIPGTKAMASEVNANFVALANAVENGKTFTTESIEEFGTFLETRLDESLGGKLELNLSNSRNISNCIIEIPNRLKFELSNGLLTLKAGSIVTVPNGFETGGTVPRFDYVEIESDVVLGGATSDSEIRAVCYNTQSGTMNHFKTTLSGTSAPSISGSAYFYNTNTNKVIQYDNGAAVAGNCSFPICLVKADGTYFCGSIYQIFNGMGFIGSTYWLDKDVKGLAPNELNADGTLKNLEWTIPRCLTYTLTTQTQTQIVYYNTVSKALGYNQSRFTRISDNSSQEVTTNPTHTYYEPLNNITGSNGVTFPLTMLFEIRCTNGVVDSLTNIRFCNLNGALQGNTLCTGQASDKFSPASNYRPAVVVDTYQNGTTWYRVWSDGWKEQGGRSGNGSITVTYPQAFANTNYLLLVSPYSSDNSADNCNVNTISSTGFTAGIEGNKGSFWYACGY